MKRKKSKFKQMRNSPDNAYFVLRQENIIAQGKVVLWSYKQEYPYLVYKDISGKICVNTSFDKNDKDEYICCKYYTRILANSMTEYNAMSKENFEKTVYGAWMDGAR